MEKAYPTHVTRAEIVEALEVDFPGQTADEVGSALQYLRDFTVEVIGASVLPNLAGGWGIADIVTAWAGVFLLTPAQAVWSHKFMPTPEGQPKVFISYSWGNSEYVKRVGEVADYLEGNGIWVEMDRYLEPGANLYAFMETMVRDASIDKVFCFCDQSYTTKAESGQGGVGTEAAIITPEIYEQVKGNRDQERHRYVVIAMDVDERDQFVLPVMFRSLLVVPMTDPTRDTDVFEELTRIAAGRPRRERRMAATLPAHLRPDAQNVHRLGTAGKAQTARMEARNQGPRRGIAALKDYLQDIREAVVALEPGEEFDDRRRVERLLDENGAVLREIALVLDAAAQFIDSPLDELLGTFFQDLLTYNFSYTAPAQRRAFSRVFTTEAFVLTQAAFIRHRRFEEASQLLERGYWSRESDRAPETYGLFSYGPEDLNDDRWIEVIRRRCRDLSGIPATEYNQADLLMFLRGAFHDQWVWNMTLAQDWMRASMPLAREVTTLTRAQPLEIMLNMTLAQIIRRLATSGSNPNGMDPLGRNYGVRGTFAYAMNLENLQRVIGDRP